MSSQTYIRVQEAEGEAPIEIPLEPNNTLLLPTLTAQFPKCTGLKYKSNNSECFRGLRLTDDLIYPPPEGWENNVYQCVFPKDNKRKGDREMEDSTLKIKCLEGRRCTDLIVLNLPWQSDELSLRNYFSRFGELVMVQIKKDPATQKSRGYGFIRFKDYSAQVICLSEQHVIDNRVCDVRVPISKIEGDRQDVCRKIHVGQLNEKIGVETLRDFFSKYGRVVDVFIPKPFRSFAFVTFEEADAATSVMGKDLKINGCTVTIGSAVPKLPSGSRQTGLSQPNSLSMMSNNSLWSGGWPPNFGMLGGDVYGSRKYGHSEMNPVGGGTGPMGLNPAAAAAAATLAAQYTRAHQRQNSIAAAAASPTSPTRGAIPDHNMNFINFKRPNTPGSSAALATLNILNNPNVVAAIVSAAAGAATSPVFSTVPPR